MEKNRINIEVVYVTPERAWVIPIKLHASATVKDALEHSTILSLCPEIDLAQQKVGIFSVIVSMDHIVEEGDRIEIYRPLSIDPITRRFQRVKKERKKS